MRITFLLVRGWLAAAAAVVILCAITDGDVRAGSPPAHAVKPGAVYAATSAVAGDLVIPVVGVSSASLHDTFAQARGGSRVHHAIDILAPRGTPVVAAVDGQVRKLYTSVAGGLTIYQFDARGEKVYYYAHLDGYAPGIEEGLQVRQGDLLGYVGTTGNAPEGTPHLHFAVENLPPTREWWKGTPVNPYPLLVERGVTVTSTRVSALR